MSSIPPPQERFKNTIIGLSSFCKELCEDLRKKKFNVDVSMIHLAGLYLSSMDDFELIDNFILKSNMYWKEIRERNENFFISHSAEIFGLPKEQLTVFTDFFVLKDTQGKPVVSKDDKDLIWEYFESLVRISIHHIHQERKPRLKTKMVDGAPVLEDGEPVKVKEYVKGYFLDFNLANAAKKWDVTLEWK